MAATVGLLVAGAAFAQDVTTGASPAGTSNRPGQADVDVDWAQDLTVSVVQVGGGWLATQVTNDDVYGNGPEILNLITIDELGGVNDPGGLTTLSTAELHRINVQAGLVVQRIAGEGTNASIILGGGQDWDFDFIDDNDNDVYDAGEGVQTGYGIHIEGTVLAPADGGANAIEITDSTGLIFVEIGGDGTVTGDIVDSGGADTIVDLFPENDQAGAMTATIDGNVSTGAGEDLVIVEAISDSGDPLVASGATTAAITGNVHLGGNTSFDAMEVVVDAITGDAAATIGGSVTFSGTGELLIDAIADNSNAATVTITGPVTMSGSVSELEIIVEQGTAGGTALVHLVSGLTLGSGQNAVEIMGDGLVNSAVVFNSASDGSGTSAAITGNVGMDEILLSDFASGMLVLDIDLASHGGGNDVVALENVTLTGDVLLGAGGFSELLSLGDDQIIGSVATAGDTNIDVAGSGLTIDGNLDVAGDTLLTRSAGTGSLAVVDTSGGTGDIDITNNATLGLSDAALLSGVANGITTSDGTGTLSVTTGELDEANAALGDGLGLALGPNASVVLAGNQSFSQLTGAGTLDANGASVALNGDGTDFTGAITNMQDLLVSGQNVTLGGGYSFGETANDTVALTVDNAPAVVTLAGDNTITGDIAVTQGDLTLSGTNTFGDNAGDAALTVASGAAARLLGANTITGLLDVAGTLTTTNSGIGGAAGVVVRDGATLGAASAAGLTLANPDLSDLDADGEGFSLSGATGAVTLQGPTLGSIAGGGTINLAATDTTHRITLVDLALNDGATNEILEIAAGRVYLTGNLDSGNAGDVIQAANGAFLVLDTNDLGAGAVQAGAGTLLYGPNYDVTSVTMLDPNTGVETGGGDVELTAATVTLDGGAVFDGGGNVEIQNTTDFNGTAPTLQVGSGTIVVINNVANLGGTLTKQGAGTLALAATVDQPVAVSGGELLVSGSISAATTVAGATLGLASNTAITGPLAVNNAQLYASGATRTIPNTASVDLQGNLTVTGSNDLVVEAPVTLSAPATVAVQNSRTTISGDINGANGLTKDGNGVLVLTGTNTFAGATDVDAGTLVINGSVASDVNNSATLQGTGTIGGNLNSVGGTLAPGNSVGTITIGGNFDLDAASTLEVEVDSDTTPIPNDLVDVAGAATLASGSTIHVVKLGTGLIPDGHQATAITAAGGLTDNGAAVTSSSAFLDWAGAVVGNDYVLTATNVATFSDVATSGNNSAIAAALDAGLSGADGSVLLGELQALDAASFNAATTALSPQSYGSAPASSVQAAQAFNLNLTQAAGSMRSGLGAAARQNVNNPMRGLASATLDPALLAAAIAQPAPGLVDPMASRYSVFVKGYGIFTNIDSATNRTGFDSDTGGVLLGGDLRLDDHIAVGLAFGYAHTSLDYAGSAGSGDIDTFRVGPYLTYRRDQWLFDAAVTYGHHEHEMERNIVFGGINRTASSDYDGHDVSVYATLGYDLPLGESTVLTPLGSLQYVRFMQNGFTESGAGAANLSVEDADYDSLRSLLGVRFAHRRTLGAMTLVPEVLAGWLHEFADDEQDIDAQFVAGTTPFTIQTTGLQRDSLLLGAGMAAEFESDLSLFLRYDGQFHGDGETHAVTAGVSFAF